MINYFFCTVHAKNYLLYIVLQVFFNNKYFTFALEEKI